MITPMRSGVKPVSQPQGRQNSSVGMGCSKKQKPAAERRREFITGWIGLYPTRKGADVEQEALPTEMGKSSYGYEKVDAGNFPVTGRNHGKPRRWSLRPSSEA